MRIVIIASGQSPARSSGGIELQADDLIVGADGGAVQALAWGLVPHVVIGDMDSLPASDRAALEGLGCRFVVHPRAKDETDLELALSYAVEQGAQEITILAAFGGRLDHTLANLLLLTLPQLAGRTVRIVDGREEALLVRGGETLSLRGRPGDRVSLLPLGGDAYGATTSGLAWPLHGETLRFGFSRGVSNEMVEAEAKISLADGWLLVIHTMMGNEIEGADQDAEGRCIQHIPSAERR